MNRKRCGQRIVRSRLEPGTLRLHPAEEDLIVDAVVDADRVRVSGSVDPLPRISYDLGVPPCQTRIEDVTMMVKRSDNHQAALELLLREMQNPASRVGPDLFTTEDIADFFGLTRNDMEKIVRWLQSHNLESICVSPARTSVTFSGSLLAIETAFRTEFHRYRFANRDYLANALELSIPAAFAGVIGGFCKPGGLIYRPKTDDGLPPAFRGRDGF